jgi:hypothetical protein
MTVFQSSLCARILRPCRSRRSDRFFASIRFLHNAVFSRVILLASRPTPNLEDQGVSLCLGSTLRPVRHGRPYQYLRYRRHSSPGHRVTQVPPPLQGGDTFGRAAFTPRKYSWYSFSLGAEPTPGPCYGRKEYVTEKSSNTTGNRSRDRLTSNAAH